MKQKFEIEYFLKTTVGPFQSIQPVQPDASTRRYFRVQTSEGAYILCCDENALKATPEEYSFFLVYNLFQKYSVPVPEIYTIDFERGFILQQDLGNQLLEQSFKGMSIDEQKNCYRQCLDILIKIQQIEFDGSIPFHLAFDMEKLMFEFNFFIEHALQGFFKAGMTGNELQNISKSFIAIAEILQREDVFVLNHRDYHCRNIMLVNDQPYIIDFQDARMGLPHYDLASILRDPYLILDDSMYTYLYNYYYTASLEKKIHSFKRDEFDYYFDIMAFQRLIKAIGTYGFQTIAKGSDRYTSSIITAIAYLQEIAARQTVLKECWGKISGYMQLL